jgi:hypothetical protein
VSLELQGTRSVRVGVRQNAAHAARALQKQSFTAGSKPMNKHDFSKIIGVENENAEYLPVACMLRSGYGCAGYYNAELNRDLQNTCVLVNARLVAFDNTEGNGRQATIQDFNEFLEEIVTEIYKAEETLPGEEQTSDVYGKTIPLTAVSLDEVALVYPVAHIGTLMHRVEEDMPTAGVPTFFDFNNKSIVVKLLRTRLW